ncbi:MAG: hypothetical protein WCL51_16905 [Bacteroidota bacterium]
MVSIRNKTGIWATITRNLKATYIPELKVLKVINTHSGETIEKDTYICLTASDWGNTIKQLQNKYHLKIKK